MQKLGNRLASANYVVIPPAVFSEQITQQLINFIQTALEVLQLHPSFILITKMTFAEKIVTTVVSIQGRRVEGTGNSASLTPGHGFFDCRLQIYNARGSGSLRGEPPAISCSFHSTSLDNIFVIYGPDTTFVCFPLVKGMLL